MKEGETGNGTAPRAAALGLVSKEYYSLSYRSKYSSQM
jgi:hypothetical protein